MQGLKKRLDSAKAKWIDELSNVLWSYHTTPHSHSLENSFSLCFGTKALLPVKIGLSSICLDNFSLEWNNLKISKNLALLYHIRSNTAICEYNYKRSLAKHKNSRMGPHTLMLGDLVLCKNFISHQELTRKLDANWKSSYIITKVNSNGSFRLKDNSGNISLNMECR